MTEPVVNQQLRAACQLVVRRDEKIAALESELAEVRQAKVDSEHERDAKNTTLRAELAEARERVTNAETALSEVVVEDVVDMDSGHPVPMMRGTPQLPRYIASLREAIDAHASKCGEIASARDRLESELAKWRGANKRNADKVQELEDSESRLNAEVSRLREVFLAAKHALVCSDFRAGMDRLSKMVKAAEEGSDEG